MKEKIVMDKTSLNRVLTRVAHEILEHNRGAKNLAIVGIRSRGVHLARRLSNKIKEIEKVKVPIGALDITFYRDDVATHLHPRVASTEIDFDVEGKLIVLVDDVLYTGRTIRAAMDAITDFGRPASVQLAVMIDRGHRELPIRADYVGKNIPTSQKEEVKVNLKEVDGVDSVVIEEDVSQKPSSKR